MSFEDSISQNMFQYQAEKSFIDKLLSKEDVHNIRQIIRKEKLTREDLLDLLYLLSSSESKLLNYGEWDRYVILKYFVWIREFVKVAEILYDYQDDLKKKEKEEKISLTPRTKQLLYNNERLIEHNVKFMVDLYFNIGRTSLSLGSTGFLELLKNKFEMSYPQASLNTPQQSEKPSLLRWRR